MIENYGWVLRVYDEWVVDGIVYGGMFGFAEIHVFLVRIYEVEYGWHDLVSWCETDCVQIC